MVNSDDVTTEDQHEHSAHEHWEAMYTEREQTWSGNPNKALVDVIGGIHPGHAVDLGAGEGADAIWLAQQGWTVTGIEISATALQRADLAAQQAGIDAGTIHWAEQDLAGWQPAEEADLVSACFLHSTLEFDRTAILRRAATAVRPGGRLFILSHAASPPWARHDHDDDEFPAASEEVAALELSPNAWKVELAEHRFRDATGPDGEEAQLEDVVVLVRRL